MTATIADVILATDPEGEWEALYVGGHLRRQGHDIPLRAVVEAILELSSVATDGAEPTSFEEVPVRFEDTAPECAVHLVVRP